MEITYLGLIFFPVGLGLLVISERWLYWATIFFIPFTASSLINFTSGFWLSPFNFFSGLWFLRYSLTLLFFNHKFQRSDYFFCAFFFTVIGSQVMPIYINGDLFIKDTILTDGKGPLFFSSRNITVPFYIFYGLIFASLLSARNSNFYCLKETLRVYVFSALFVSVFGIFQFICNLTDTEYPYFIFNNSLNPVAQGYSQILSGLHQEYSRVSSTASEPSVLAQFLIPVLPIVLLAILSKQYILTKVLDLFVLITIIFVLIVSTSGTAYFGLILSSLAVPLIARIYLKNVRRVTDILLAINLLVLFLTYLFLKSYLNDFLIDKFIHGSGEERMMTIKYCLSYFIDYPFFGIGWGSSSSNDLLVQLLASSGLTGLCIFLLMTIYLIVGLSRALFGFYFIHRSSPVEFIGPYSVGILISFLLTLAVHQLSGFNYGYGYFWMSIGLAVAAKSCLRKSMLNNSNSIFLHS